MPPSRREAKAGTLPVGGYITQGIAKGAMSDRPGYSLTKRLSSRPFSRADDEASIKRLRRSSTVLLECRLEDCRKKLFALQELFTGMDPLSHPQTGRVRALRRKIELIERVLNAREDNQVVARPEAAAPAPAVCVEAERPASIAERAAARKAVVMPILGRKGWSISKWATESGVDNHTAANYLMGKTTPYPDTRKMLADALGIKPEQLPK